MNGNGTWDASDHPTNPYTYKFGFAGAIPVTGDWNHDGTTEIGVYYNGTWYLDYNGNGKWDDVTGGDMTYTYGFSGAIPVTGNWDGNVNHKTEIGVYSNGTWKTGELFPFNPGDLFIFDVQDSALNTWQMYILVSGWTRIVTDGKSYATIEQFGYNRDDNKIDIKLLRATSNECYYYDGAGIEYPVCQIVPVGTTWTYQEINGDTHERKLEAIETVIVPAGTFSDCLKTCQRHISPPPTELLTCEWINPGFGMVKEVDYSTDNAPVTKVLNSKVTYP